MLKVMHWIFVRRVYELSITSASAKVFEVRFIWRWYANHLVNTGQLIQLFRLGVGN